MKIIEKLIAKQNDPAGAPPVTFAFLGDSVTQGCFESYVNGNGNVQTFFDKNNAYHAHFAKLLALLYPSVPVNIINAGISGGWAKHGLARLERDVLRFSPDLTVVCFGLNDCQGGRERIAEYAAALRGIFTALCENGIETVFMTPNMMCTKVSHTVDRDLFRNVAAAIAGLQNAGILDRYIAAAIETAHNCGVRICDCYAKWKRMNECGVDTTELLANKINHPDRDMNWLFAFALTETMFE